MLQGRVIETNEGENDGVSATIIEGRIVNNVISFYTKGEYSGSNDNAVPYKELYTGFIKNGGREISFQRLDDIPSGGEVEKFVAKPKQ